MIGRQFKLGYQLGRIVGKREGHDLATRGWNNLIAEITYAIERSTHDMAEQSNAIEDELNYFIQRNRIDPSILVDGRLDLGMNRKARREFKKKMKKGGEYSTHQLSPY